MIRGDRTDSVADASAFARVHAVARQIPRGRVATYGQLARIAGTTARTAGFAMAAVDPADRVPWHRVVNARGRTSLKGLSAARQLALLRAEGVRLDPTGRIDLARWGWLPEPEPPSPRVRRRPSSR